MTWTQVLEKGQKMEAAGVNPRNLSPADLGTLWVACSKAMLAEVEAEVDRRGYVEVPTVA